jgi:hypothetical protein
LKLGAAVARHCIEIRMVGPPGTLVTAGGHGSSVGGLFGTFL